MSAPSKKRLVAIVIGLLAVAAAVGLAPHVYADLDPLDVEARYAPGPSRFTDVAGQRTHYRDEGTGDITILLIHGTGSSLHTWDGWAEVLSERHRVLRLDLPGFGLTGPDPRARYDAADYVAFVEAFAERLDLERFVLAGNSLGGLISWRYALAHPERVSALGLVDPAGFPRENPPMLILLGKLPVIGEMMSMITPVPVVRDQVETCYHDTGRIAPGTVERYHQLLLREGNRTAYRRYTRSERFDVDARRVSEIEAPTLVMWGRHDQLIPVSDAHRFAEALPNAELVIYEDAGHIPMEEIPARSAADFQDFVERSLR